MGASNETTTKQEFQEAAHGCSTILPAKSFTLTAHLRRLGSWRSTRTLAYTPGALACTLGGTQMWRRIAWMTMVWTATACGSGGTGVDGGADAGGPCDPVRQLGCAADLKCTLDLAATSTSVTATAACSPAGAAEAYATCASDADCAAGTLCIAPPAATGYQATQACYPFCDTGTQAGLPCVAGGSCLIAINGTNHVGICDRAAVDAGVTDAG